MMQMVLDEVSFFLKSEKYKIECFNLTIALRKMI